MAGDGTPQGEREHRLLHSSTLLLLWYGLLTVSGVRAAEHVRVRGVAEALPSPGPQVAQVLVILQQGDDNNDN